MVPRNPNSYSASISSSLPCYNFKRRRKSNSQCPKLHHKPRSWHQRVIKYLTKVKIIILCRSIIRTRVLRRETVAINPHPSIRVIHTISQRIASMYPTQLLVL
jgi:hypothetical protein